MLSFFFLNNKTKTKLKNKVHKHILSAFHDLSVGSTHTINDCSMSVRHLLLFFVLFWLTMFTDCGSLAVLCLVL